MVINPQQVGPVEDKHTTVEAPIAHVSYWYFVRLGNFFYVQYEFPYVFV
jgi:hypothetical protein